MWINNFYKSCSQFTMQTYKPSSDPNSKTISPFNLTWFWPYKRIIYEPEYTTTCYMVIDTLFGNLVKINPPSKFSLNQLWPTICRGALLLNCAGYGRRIRFGLCPLCLARFNTSGSVHDSSPSLKLPFLVCFPNTLFHIIYSYTGSWLLEAH